MAVNPDTHNSTLVDHTRELARLLEAQRDGRHAGAAKWGTILLAGVLIFSTAYWLVANAENNRLLSQVTPATLNPVLVPPCELMHSGHTHEHDIKLESFAVGSVYVRFEGSLPEGTHGEVDLWLQNGERVVIHHFEIDHTRVGNGTVFATAINIPPDANIDLDDWMIGASVELHMGEVRRAFPEIILAE